MQMTAPSGDSGTLQLTRTSAEHVDPDQSADKRPADKRPYVLLGTQELAERLASVSAET
jgi:hypothetical protein